MVMWDHISVDNMKLTKQQLIKINGGGISGTLINSFVRGINAILDLGRSLGTAVRRIGSNKICKL